MIPISALKHMYHLRGMAQPYHPGSGSHGQLLRPHQDSSAWPSPRRQDSFAIILIDPAVYCRDECKNTPLSASSTVDKWQLRHAYGDGIHWECTVTIVQCRYETVLYNSPFPNSFKPLFQSEGQFKAIDMKITFYSHANKARINNEKFSLSLVFKVRVFQTRKWSIELFGCGRVTKHLLQF